MSNSIEKITTKSPIQVSRVYKSDFQKEKSLTAELRQEITVVSKYPTASMNNSLNTNLFSNDDFGIETKNYSSKETRVAFINVPESMDTAEKVQEHLAKFPNLCLYRILSNKPILSAEDIRAIEKGFITKDTKANSQIIRYPENSENAGQIALDNMDRPQYRRICISSSQMEDRDERNSEPNDFYMSAEIRNELNISVVEEAQRV